MLPLAAFHSTTKVVGFQARFVVKDELFSKASLLPVETWDAFTAKNWDVHYWGSFESTRHRHYRHPQVLVLDWDGFRVEFIGLHLKSKFVNYGASLWNAGGKKRHEFIHDALKARIKLTTEASNGANILPPNLTRSNPRRSSSWET